LEDASKELWSIQSAGKLAGEHKETAVGVPAALKAHVSSLIDEGYGPQRISRRLRQMKKDKLLDEAALACLPKKMRSLEWKNLEAKFRTLQKSVRPSKKTRSGLSMKMDKDILVWSLRHGIPDSATGRAMLG
jgi:hypothetical protein